MRKHGFENFSIEIVEEGIFNINERECYWIKLLKPHYNMTSGGDGGDLSEFRNYNPHTEETKLKISESKKGKLPWNKGKSGYSTSKKGYKTPNETKNKLRKNAKVGVVDIHGEQFTVSVSEYKSRDDLFHNRSREGRRLILARKVAKSLAYS